MRVLNALENAILKYGMEHSNFIKNPYQYFAERLGYKSKNYLYRWFKMRNNVEVRLIDLAFICKKTGDEKPLEYYYEDTMKEIRNEK